MLDSYLFQLNVFLKPDFSFWSNFSLSLVDKVTTGKYNFVSVILNFPSPVLMHLVNGAQFLNVTPLSLSSARSEA